MLNELHLKISRLEYWFSVQHDNKKMKNYK